MAKASTKMKINHSMKAQGIVGTLELLSSEREDFELNEFARSNKRLYDILSKVLATYEAASVDKALFAETKHQLKVHLVSVGCRVQENTKDLALFVRAVFRTERQRVFNYTNALEAAISRQICSGDLCEFIEKQGGIEECKKLSPSVSAASANAIAAAEQKKKTIDEHLPYVIDQLNSAREKPLASFSVNPSMVVTTRPQDYVFAIAAANQNGAVSILSLVPAHDKKLEGWALEQLAIYLSNQKSAAKQHADLHNKEAAIDAAISQALQKKMHASQAFEAIAEHI